SRSAFAWLTAPFGRRSHRSASFRSRLAIRSRTSARHLPDPSHDTDSAVGTVSPSASLRDFNAGAHTSHMGIFDGLRSSLGMGAEASASREANPEDLFGLSTAYLTMEADLGFDPAGVAAL